MRRVVGGILAVALVAAVLTYGAIAAFRPHPVAVTAVAPLPATAQPVTVLEVMSGDTVIVSVQHPTAQLPTQGQITARLIGVDSPNFGIIDDCFAQESQARLAELLPEGSTAWLLTDTQAQDLGGRWLTYLWAEDGRLVNYLLAVDGFVRAQASPPNSELFDVIAAGQASAASRFGGLWGECRG